MNTRLRLVLFIIAAALLLAAIAVAPAFITDEMLAIHPETRNQAPDSAHWFGTDYLGRDVFTRTIVGLNNSLKIALLATLVGIAIGTTAGIFAAAMQNNWIGKGLDFTINAFMSLPHLIFGVTLCIVFGGGTAGIVAAVAFTHWANMARVSRTETRQIMAQPYIRLAENFGQNRLAIAVRHIIPGVFKQSLVAAVLLFPHAVLHESSFSFIGVGLSPHLPSIGVMLSDAIRYLPNGYWWMGILPGLSLVLMVLVVDRLGDAVKRIHDSKTSQK